MIQYRTKLLLAGVLLGVIGLFAFPHAVSAYDNGHLIDDAIFLNASSMKEADIQSFLANKRSGLASRVFLFDCDSAGATSASYYRSSGAPCGSTVKASTIIYYAAQIYGINPQAVLATLQKEQSLVTNPNPSDWAINQAMGYGCPDSGGCGSSNFLYQVDNGTWVLRYHRERANGNMDWWRRSNSWTCGSAKNYYSPNLYPNQNVSFYDDNGVKYTTVWLANPATSSMYCYTPHAYNNPQGLYGLPRVGTIGQYYSGSYNFVYWFEQWFGSTLGEVTATPLTITTSDAQGQRFVGDPVTLSFTVTNQSSNSFTYKHIGIAGRDPQDNNIDQIWLDNFTLRPHESRTISATYTPRTEGEYQFFVSSWLEGDDGWRACDINKTKSTCFNPYIIQNKPQISLAYQDTSLTSTRVGNTIPVIYTISNPSNYTFKVGSFNMITWIDGGWSSNNPVNVSDIAPNSSASAALQMTVPTKPTKLINFQATRNNIDGTTPVITVKPAVALTKGLTLSTSSPHAGEAVTGSFKIKNFSDQPVTKNEQLCYIIRDIPETGAHDFGCLDIGTLQPGQELEFSKVGHFSKSGNFRAYFAVYNGKQWRANDTYLPEVGPENTTLLFSVKPAVTLTQGLSLSDPNPRQLNAVTGSFKIKNFSDQPVTKNEQLCYIIRDIPETGAHDFGCLDIGTLQPGQELEFSKVGHFSKSGNFRAYFAVYNGKQWRANDTYLPEVGPENTTLLFSVKP